MNLSQHSLCGGPDCIACEREQVVAEREQESPSEFGSEADWQSLLVSAS